MKRKAAIDLTITLHHYFHSDGAPDHARIVDLIRTILKGQQRIMATLDELLQQAKDTRQAITDLGVSVDAIPPAIDALEAAVTAAIEAGGISDENQAKIDEAFETLRTGADDLAAKKAKLDAAAADAADGVDEAATPPTP